MDQEISSTTGNWKSVSQLGDKEKDKKTKKMAKVSSGIKQCEEKNEKDRKNQKIAFSSRKGRKTTVSKPEDEEEVPECSSTTSDAQCLPDEDP
ncbi:unnamed protein product [Pipistrellus nathusii]|uniref:Uncharacterized protein n=1 Tax=Pipistrellus nathusii TaxID=59473 RepID=A0ABP0AM11_PIPNA